MDFEKYMELAEVPPVHTNEILSSMAIAKELASKVIPYSLSAPLVMAFLVFFMKWEDDKMTDMLKRYPFKIIQLFWPGVEDWLDSYDNNISINGDNLDWALDELNGQYYNGNYFSHRPFPLEDTEAVRAKNYWLEGKHPRSRLSRYVWLGWRNRASKKSLKLGPSPDRTKFAVTAYHYQDDKLEVFFFTDGEYWQMRMTKKYWRFTFRRNLGYKINNFMGDLTTKMMPVWNQFAITYKKS